MRRGLFDCRSLLITAAFLVAGCADEPAESLCVEALAGSCTPLYTPTWDDVYSRTIATKCAQGGTSCHGTAPGKGGLDLSDANTAYDELLGASGDDARVIPGDASCSSLIVRIASQNAAVVMPPGDPLSPSERCVIEQWITAGAAATNP